MEALVHSQPNWAIALFTGLWFLILYFGFGAAVTWLVSSLSKRGIGYVIDTRPPRQGQKREEIRNSLSSIAIFAVFGIVTVEASRRGIVDVIWEPNWALVPLEILALTLWNELHFFLCHRVLHVRWLYKKVHHVHHRSLVTTPYTSYNMHWFEAVLLGSVLIIAMLIYDFSYVALVSLPIVSIIINVVSHSNYEVFPNAKEGSLRAAARRHRLHHAKFTRNYGFLLPLLDRLFAGEQSA